MKTNLLSQPYSDALEEYMNTNEYLVIVIVNDDFKIVDYNDAFAKFIKCDLNTTENIFNVLSLDIKECNPFSKENLEQSQRLIFTSCDRLSLSLDCTIYYLENQYLVIGAHYMITNNQIIEKMTLMSNELINMTRELHNKNKSLEEAQEKIKVLSGIIPICMFCKEIRDDQGYWNQLEEFITDHSEANFSHSICPKCMKKQYPE
jgi:hypothetical protein